MNVNVKKLRLLTNQLVENATYLGLSELTIQNMLKSALESNPGLKIHMKHKVEALRGKECKYYDLMPHHPLPNCVQFENKSSVFDLIGALFGKEKRMDKGVKTV